MFALNDDQLEQWCKKIDEAWQMLLEKAKEAEPLRPESCDFLNAIEERCRSRHLFLEVNLQ